jgi:hypothetical protein
LDLSHLSPQSHENQVIKEGDQTEKGREAKYSEVSLKQNPGQNLKRNLTENSEQPPGSSEKFNLTHTLSSHANPNIALQTQPCHLISTGLSHQVCLIPMILCS